MTGTVLPPPAPANQAQRAEASGEERKGSREGVGSAPLVPGKMETSVSNHHDGCCSKKPKLLKTAGSHEGVTKVRPPNWCGGRIVEISGN